MRQIAGQCVNFGQRVQNSVYECVMNAAQTRSLRAKLIDMIDLEKDSLRFYYLGNHYQTRVEQFGAKPSYDAEGFLLI